MAKDLTVGSPAMTVTRFAIPMVLGNLFQQLYNVVDSVVVGNFEGPDALAAVGSSFPVLFLLIAVAMGLTMGASILISQLYGANRKGEMSRAIYTSTVFLMGLSVILAIIGTITVEPLLDLLNTPENVFADSAAYLRIFMYGLPFMFVYNHASSLLRALGDSKTPLYFLIISTLTNIVLDIYFVAVLGWGVAGVAWATLIAQGASGILAVIYIAFKVPLLHIPKEERKFDTGIMKSIIQLGIPSTVQNVVYSLGMMAVQGLVNSFGSTVMAGYSASTKIDSIATMPIMNFSMALSTYVAQNMGAGKLDRVIDGFKATIKITVILSVILSAIMYLFGPNLMMLFVDADVGAGVIDFGTNYLRIVTLFYPVSSVMFTANGLLRGAGDVNATMINSMITLGSRIVATYVLASFIGHEALYWGIVIAWLVASPLAYIRYLGGKWKKGLLKPKKDVQAEATADEAVG